MPLAILRVCLALAVILCSSNLWASGRVLAINSQGVSSIPPSAVTSANLLMHLDPSSIQSSGGTVTQWTNLGTAGAPLNAVPDAFAPTVLSGALNGFDVVDFSGANQNLTTGTISPVGQPLTIFFVGQADSLANHPYWHDGVSGSNRIAYLHRNIPTTNNPDQFAGVEVSGGTAPVGSYNVWAEIFDSANNNSELNLNGVTFLATGNVGTNNFNGLTIGSRYSNAQYLDGQLAELLVFEGLLSDEEFNDVGYYLANRYGIATAFEGPPPLTPEPSTLIMFSIVLASGGLMYWKRRVTSRYSNG